MNRALSHAPFAVAWSLLLAAQAWCFSRWSSPPDFYAFWASARALQQGLNPYAAGLNSVPNANPPTWFPIFLPLAQLPLAVSLNLWRVLTLLMLTAVCVTLAQGHKLDVRAMLLLAVGTPLWTTLLDGQVYALLLLLAAAAWLALEEDREWRAGLALGLLVALKPNFAVWPLLLFAAGRRRAGLTAAVTSATAMLAAVLVYGSSVFLGWLDVAGIGSGTRWTDALQLALPSVAVGQNASILSFALRHGVGGLATPASVALIVGATVWVIRRRPAGDELNTAALGVCLLASPLAWVGYLLVFMPRWLRCDWRVCEWSAAVLLSAPVVVMVFERDLYFVALALMTAVPMLPSLPRLPARLRYQPLPT